jgi:hypothetical protein
LDDYIAGTRYHCDGNHRTEMHMAKTEHALIVGVGAGLSASLARRLRH